MLYYYAMWLFTCYEVKGVISMSDIIDGLKAMDTSTLAILGFAAILLIFLLVLIIITIRVLKSDYIDEEEPSKDKETPIPDEDDEEYYDDDEDEEDEDDDETSRKIREAVESVEVTKAKYEAEKIAQELEEAENQEKDKARINAAARVEAIANAVHEKNEASDEGEDDDYEDDYEDEEETEDTAPAETAADAVAEAAAEDAPAEVSEETEELEEEYSQDDGEEPDPDDADTNELDTDKIKAELRKERDAVKESESELNEMAKQRAEAPEYNASFDSAFVDRPVYEEKVDPVIPNPTPESILGAVPEPNPELLQETPAVSDIDTPLPPKKKKKKKKSRDIDKEIDKEEKKEKRVPRPAVPMSDGKVAKFFWYNQQDVEGLERKEDMYFKSHYFNEADEVILDLITEMYDCGFVRTEELQRIAYGITFKSLGMKEILRSNESLGFNKDSATKEPTEADKQEAFEKWCKYVDNFMEIIVINAPDEVRDYIIDQMYDYGHHDIEDLMYSPY